MIYPTVLNIPHGTPRYAPTVLNIPHGTHGMPPRYWTSPTVLRDASPHDSWYAPTVLNIRHGTHGMPPRYWISPTVLRDASPHDSWYAPMVLNIRHGTEHPHGTAHTLYRVIRLSFRVEIMLTETHHFVSPCFHRFDHFLVEIQTFLRDYFAKNTLLKSSKWKWAYLDVKRKISRNVYTK